MIDEIIGILLHLSTQDKVRLDGIPEASQAALAAGLTVISADKFMGAIQPVVASDDETVRPPQNRFEFALIRVLSSLSRP